MIQPSTVYLNGQFISGDRASISTDDRGFYFADGVYEVIKFYKGNPFCFSEHMHRLKNSLDGIQIQFAGIEKLEEVSRALIIANQLRNENAGVYIQITRGTAPRTHRFPSEPVHPTVFARAFAMPGFFSEMQEGVQVMTREDIRWKMCHIKSIGLLPNTLLFEEVARKGAFECLLVRDGSITEATHSNFMGVKEGAVYTHPASNFILSGITRAAVIRVCREHNISVVETPIKANEMATFNEFFITGTGSEVVPVVKIDNITVGIGKPGPITGLIQKEFIALTYGALGGESINLDSFKNRM
jgi:D-alanine transaminase